VVGIKHNKRKEKCTGSEDVTRDHRCAHLAPSVTSLARTSRLMRRRRYSHVDGVACSPALEVPPPRGFGDAAACLHKGLAADRGTSATTRRGNGVAATGLGIAATTQGRCRRSPSGSGAPPPAWKPPPPHKGAAAAARPLDRGPPPSAWEPPPPPA
jgi:hypothetical protein